MSDAEVVRAYCNAWMAGDVMAVLTYYHDDLTLEWPGRHRFAGLHVGLQASADALLALQGATDRQPVEIIDVLEGSTTVAATVRERWTRTVDESGNESGAEVLEHTRVLEFTVVDEQLRTCRVFESQQGAIDEWLGTDV